MLLAAGVLSAVLVPLVDGVSSSSLPHAATNREQTIASKAKK